MVGAERLLRDRQRALEERLGVGVAALGSVQLGQVVERDGDIGVVGAERLLADRQRALEERLGVGVAALGSVQLGQVVERVGDIGVVGAERLLRGSPARACRAARRRRSGPGLGTARPGC